MYKGREKGMTTLKSDYSDLTEAEELFVELLIARHRLGETMWNFSMRELTVARRLRKKGYIETKAGITEGNFRAWLTDEAKDVLLAFPYVPPILRDK